MPPIVVTVSWPAGASGPVVDRDPIVVPKGAGATVIRWVCGESVSTLEITGLDALGVLAGFFERDGAELLDHRREPGRGHL